MEFSHRKQEPTLIVDHHTGVHEITGKHLNTLNVDMYNSRHMFEPKFNIINFIIFGKHLANGFSLVLICANQVLMSYLAMV